MGCEHGRVRYAAGLHKVQLRGSPRKYLLFQPSKYNHQQLNPLWIVAPGAYQTAERMLQVSELSEWAESKNMILAALESTQIEGLNVGLHSQAVPGMPDDVGYTRDVLRDASHSLCLNMDRVRCVGYSRGARFCSLLASKLSSFIKGIAPVAGLRYPLPNAAAWPMPVIAVHGTKDRINPYWGKGNPTYWNMSVPQAVDHWSTFNGCKYYQWAHETKHVILNEHFDCKGDASVVLAMVDGDGHTWPGSSAFGKQFGVTTQEIKANDLIRHFFMKHPVSIPCHIAKQGETCYEEVLRAMREGLIQHPDWAGRITEDSSFEEYQALLHDEILADCPDPCILRDQPSNLLRFS